MNYIIKALIPLCILAVWLSHNTTTGEALVYTIFSFCLGAWFLVGVERRKEWRTAQYRNEAEIKRKAWDMYQEEKELGKLCKIRNFSQSPFGGFIFEESDGNFPSGRN